MKDRSKMLGGSNGEAEALAEIVGILMMSRTYAHLAHLKTSSYAKHEALGGFYDCVVGFADSIAESGQGIHGKLDIPFVDMMGSVDDPIRGLSMQLTKLETLSSAIKEDFLANIFQEVQQLFRSTQYKLKELV